METPIQIHDLGGPPLVLETSIYIYIHTYPLKAMVVGRRTFLIGFRELFRGELFQLRGGGGKAMSNTHTHMHTNYLGTFKSRHVLIFVHLTPG